VARWVVRVHPAFEMAAVQRFPDLDRSPCSRLSMSSGRPDTRNQSRPARRDGRMHRSYGRDHRSSPRSWCVKRSPHDPVMGLYAVSAWGVMGSFTSCADWVSARLRRERARTSRPRYRRPSIQSSCCSARTAPTRRINESRAGEDTDYIGPAADHPVESLLGIRDRAWIEAGILTGYSNSRSEGYNRLAKHQGRNAFGFRNPVNQRRRIRWACTRQYRRASAARSTLPA
jgi:Transposase